MHFRNHDRAHFGRHVLQRAGRVSASRRRTGDSSEPTLAGQLRDRGRTLCAARLGGARCRAGHVPFDRWRRRALLTHVSAFDCKRERASTNRRLPRRKPLCAVLRPTLRHANRRLQLGGSRCAERAPAIVGFMLRRRRALSARARARRPDAFAPDPRHLPDHERRVRTGRLAGSEPALGRLRLAVRVTRPLRANVSASRRCQRVVAAAVELLCGRPVPALCRPTDPSPHRTV
jgi:hypothetical protein